MLFTERSLWTMIHGIGFGGAALLGLAAALFALYLTRTTDRREVSESNGRAVGRLTGLVAVMLWLTTVVGTYVVFPPYRATPPEGATDLAAYPRSSILADPQTAWLHSYAMETKEHLPWIAMMLATAVAFVAWRYGWRWFQDPRLRQISAAFLAICFVIVAYVSLLGVFINKVAPLE